MGVWIKVTLILSIETLCMQVARVLWVADGGPAKRSGIKVGDKVSNHRIPSPQTPFPFGVSVT